VEFDEDRIVSGIAIRNGYQKNSDIFTKNNRVRRLKMVFSGGESYEFSLQDTPGTQTLRLPRRVNARWVQFIIGGVYDGSKYSDTAISKLFINTE
jgi:hypothetical protein